MKARIKTIPDPADSIRAALAGEPLITAAWSLGGRVVLGRASPPWVRPQWVAPELSLYTLVQTACVTIVMQASFIMISCDLER